MVTTSRRTRPNGWLSAFTAALFFCGAAIATGGDEIAVGTPFVFMYELLGAWPGFFASVLLWFLAGVVSLVIVDYVWPRTKDKVLSTAHSWSWVIWPLGAVAIIGLVITTFFWGQDLLKNVRIDATMIGLVVLVLLFVLSLTIVLKMGNDFVEASVRKVAEITNPIKHVLKPIVILAVLVYMGPVLSWALLSPLGVTRKGVYWLTALAAPLFSALWYPFYTIGVWDTVTGRIL